jgi:anthranilate phosphoribosyltransferase
VSSHDGLDEMSTAASTQVVEVSGDGRTDRYEVDAAEVGLRPAAPDAIGGGPPEHNAQVTRRIFAGESGPERDLALLNAGAAIYAGGKADALADGVRAAADAVDSGAAAKMLHSFVELTRSLGGQGRPEVDRRRQDAGPDAPPRYPHA